MPTVKRDIEFIDLETAIKDNYHFVAIVNGNAFVPHREIEEDEDTPYPLRERTTPPYNIRRFFKDYTACDIPVYAFKTQKEKFEFLAKEFK
jgi:hypothetical protein